MYNDFKVIFSKDVELKLENFIEYMGDNCRYRDSGLYDEDIIVREFVEDIKTFVRNLKNTIEDKIRDGLFGEIQISNENYDETKLVIFIRSYNIVCKTTKWKKEKIVSIDDIHIKT